MSVAISSTVDSYKYSNNKKIISSIMSIYLPKPIGFVPEISSDETSDLIGLILEKTAFYSTSGGQICDRGKLINKEKDVE